MLKHHSYLGGTSYADVSPALALLFIVAAGDVRLVGDGRSNTLFRRSPSRPVYRLPLTPIQTLIWILAQNPIGIVDLIEIICERYPEVERLDIAWVITDLRREKLLTTSLREHE